MNTTPRTDRQAGWAIPSLYGQQLTSLELLADSKGIFVHAIFARQLETELAEMTARAEKAEADTKRLNWMDDYGFEYDVDACGAYNWWCLALPANQKSVTRNLRDAIDSAMKEDSK